MLSNGSKLGQFDPNCAIAITYSKENLSLLLNELSVNSLDANVISRPGNDTNTTFVYAKVITQEEKDALCSFPDKLSFIQSIIPVRDTKILKQIDFLTSKLIKQKSLFPNDSQLIELDHLANDSDLSLYFAFYKKYMCWLSYVSAVGLLFRTVSSPWEFNISYSWILSIWSLYFIVQWVYKFKPAYFRKFGSYSTSDSKINTYKYSYLSKDVILKKVCFIPIALIFITILVSFQFVCFFIEIFITQLYSGPLVSIFALIPTVMISVFVPVMTMVYNRYFVDTFVIWENGPNPKRSKLEKNLVLIFFTNYMPLFITLFFYLPMGYMINSEVKSSISQYASKFFIPVIEDDFKINVDRYKSQFFYFTVTNQIILTIIENALPIVLSKIMPMIKKEDNSDEKKVEQTIKDSYIDDYPLWNQIKKSQLTPWGEYNVDDSFKKIISQLGFVVMFSTIWPLAPLVCLIINIIIYKADLWRAYKKSRPSSSSISVTDITHNVRNISAEHKVDADLWDTILTITGCFSSVICLTLTHMYRYCNLPGVGNISLLEKRDTWYKRNPMQHSSFSILLTAVICEHIILFTYYIFVKLQSSSQNKSNLGHVPNTSTKDHRGQKDSTNVTNKTDSFMNQVKPSVIGMRQTKPTLEIWGTFDSLPKNDDITSAAAKKEISTAQPLPITKHMLMTATTPVPQSSNSNNTEGSEYSKSTNNEELSTEDNSTESSSVAGATLPETIPTSKNYHLRFDKDGIPISSPNQTYWNDISRKDKENTPFVPEAKKASVPLAPEAVQHIRSGNVLKVRTPSVVNQNAPISAAAVVVGRIKHSKIDRNDHRRYSQVSITHHDTQSLLSNSSRKLMTKSKTHKRNTSDVASIPDGKLRHSTSKNTSLNSSKAEIKHKKGFLSKLKKKL